MSEGVAVVAEREREGETGEEIEVLLIEVHRVLRLKTTIHLTAAGDSTTMTEEEGTPLVVVVIATIRSVMVVDGEKRLEDFPALSTPAISSKGTENNSNAIAGANHHATAATAPDPRGLLSLAHCEQAMATAGSESDDPEKDDFNAVWSL